MLKNFLKRQSGATKYSKKINLEWKESVLEDGSVFYQHPTFEEVKKKKNKFQR
jgi:hypothetical protein